MRNEANESLRLDAESTPRGIGCGVEGCLTAAVMLFVVLLIGMLALVFYRIGPGLG